MLMNFFLPVTMRNRIYCLLCIFILLFVQNCIGEFGEPDDCANRNEFHCKSGECIVSDKECNGEKDCADGSDEIDCGTFSQHVVLHLIRRKGSTITI